MKKLTKKTIKKLLWNSICIFAGNALLAFLVAAFVIPHDIIMGGTTGIGILLHKFLHIDPAFLVLALNVTLLIIGLIFLGKSFFLKTVVSSILYPILLGIFERIPGISEMTDNSLLAVLIGGSMLGIAGGLVFRVGASTGGIDVVNLILHKLFHLPVAVFVYIVDFIIVGGQAIFSDSDSVLHALIFLVLEAIVLDKIMIMGKAQMQVFVVSTKYSDIRHALLTKLEAGVTMTLIETGHFALEQQAVLCVIPPHKLYSATELIHEIDPEAFITITKIKEARGQGFTIARNYDNAQKKNY